MLQSASASSASLKRKLSDRDSTSSTVDMAASSSKKAKSVSTGTPLKPSQTNSATLVFQSPSNACPEYPNGWTYCHQCCKKRDLSATIQCTWLEARTTGKSTVPKQRRCISKYCKPCLQNRYGEDLETWLGNRKWEEGHVENVGYTFACPKCRDVCNCPRCRKSKGLEPIGTMKKAPESAPVKKEKQTKDKTASAQPKKRARKSKPKILPPVKWTRIAPVLSQSEVEERMNIREFVLRFNDLSDCGLSKPHLEELEQINGKYNGQEGHDPTSWVSDACAKSVILMLLGILSTDESSPWKETSEIAVKNMRNIGFSLSKVYSTLLEWQESVIETTETSSSSEDVSNDSFSIAEPLPPSEHFFAQARRSTRTMTSTLPNSVAIHSSAQLIPVILSLIDLTLQMTSIREALEEGPKTTREIYRQAREALKLEGERWDVVKKQQEQAKDKAFFQEARRLHKDIVAALERSSDIAQCESLQRFAPLGSDPEGRVFYALSPGNAEREAAYEFTDLLAGDLPNNARLKKKGRALKPEEREDLYDWSWMILVWGKKPPSAFTPPKEEEDEDSDVDMDDDADAWWCFHEPEDIKKLAEWLAIDNDLEEKEEKGSNSKAASLSPEQAALKQLVSSLKDFGSLLEWRTRDDKYRLPNTNLKSASASAKSKAK
ncbi:hypothetical protein EST38_g2871 [Candolleomyces aberdarensis]|uniref:Zinc-finger domain-containing protein n=1 Tax=Candolleomyces aberdarensis TaxID=2316362 RepID=A0A4V1Q4R4_9AGAR|nr:hypothetical protein EST38_g2871 [Candolleomyces aberdarensis]